jgi:hypothetical protein
VEDFFSQLDHSLHCGATARNGQMPEESSSSKTAAAKLGLNERVQLLHTRLDYFG